MKFNFSPMVSSMKKSPCTLRRGLVSIKRATLDRIPNANCEASNNPPCRPERGGTCGKVTRCRMIVTLHAMCDSFATSKLMFFRMVKTYIKMKLSSKVLETSMKFRRNSTLISSGQSGLFIFPII